MEANEEKRQAYQNLTKDISEENLVYVDESGMEEGSCKEYAWSEVGQPVQGKRSGKTYKRMNIIGALHQGRCLAPFTFYGACNTEIFNLWLEKILIPELKPGQVVVLDNASFHKSKKTRDLIEGAGCRLIFLPPYSPDFNPIEKFWAKMKKWVRNMIHNFENLYQTLTQFFNT
ncbi:MAG: IS630 family transposase [Alphaproteobacteria bacterium]|nr:IS630 family transposase [Alphaproteobacteria bacterium]